MTDSRTNYGQQIDNLIRGAYGSKIKVFDQTIPRSVRAAEISAVGKSIFQHDPKGKVAEAYKSLTKEVLADAEKQLKRVAEMGQMTFSPRKNPGRNSSGNRFNRFPLESFFLSRIIPLRFWTMSPCSAQWKAWNSTVCCLR